MFIQNSYTDHEIGQLYVVPTPIGNLDDMTFRAVNVLRDVHLIAAEDTRHTKKLLNHFDIHNELISYHEHNRNERIPFLIEKLHKGEQIALVSDAGMPAISDPGYELVEAVIEHRFPVIVLPGANAAISALVGSGLSTKQFLFYGFLPRKNRDKSETLKRLKNEQATLIFYESPYRIVDTLKDIELHWGERKVAIARELTKVYEQFIRGGITDVLNWVKDNPLKGECVIIVEGADENGTNESALWWSRLSIKEHVQHYELIERVNHKEAMRLVAQDRNISRKEVYNKLHVKKEE